MRSSRERGFVDGMRRALPIVISVGPFAILFGALAVDNGLTPLEAVAMSATIYGGASQMVGIQLFGSNVAPWLIVLSIFAVNFRHILYSATIGRKLFRLSALEKAAAFFFLVDPQFAETEKHAETGREITFSWYLGVALPVYCVWVGFTVVGVYFGRLIGNPEALGLDFLLPVYFLGLVMEFRGRANWLPVVATSAVASSAAYHFIGSPWHVGVGALGGIVVAAMMPLSGNGVRRVGTAERAEG